MMDCTKKLNYSYGTDPHVIKCTVDRQPIVPRERTLSCLDRVNAQAKARENFNRLLNNDSKLKKALDKFESMCTHGKLADKFEDYCRREEVLKELYKILDHLSFLNKKPSDINKHYAAKLRKALNRTMQLIK